MCIAVCLRHLLIIEEWVNLSILLGAKLRKLTCTLYYTDQVQNQWTVLYEIWYEYYDRTLMLGT
jgi:hypothetical protein